jgi:hypothetical protein
MTETERLVLRAQIESVILRDLKCLEIERPAVDRPLDLRVWMRKQAQLGKIVYLLEAALSPETLRRAKAVLGAAMLNPC